MKNIYKLLIAMVVLVSSIELAKAQSSTYSNPWPGSSHTYSFGDNGTTNTTEWFISRNADGSNPIVGAAGNHFTIVGEGVAGTIDAKGVLSGKGINTLRVNWDGNATGVYYIFLQVIDATTSCSNLKGYMVDVVTGRFNALAENVTGGTTDDKNPEFVDDAKIVAEGCSDETGNRIVNDGTFSLGTTEVVFRVKRQYSLNEWHIDYGLSVGTTTKVVAADGSTIAVAAGGGYDIPSANDYVLVYVSVPNVETSAQAVVLTLDSAKTKDNTTSTTDAASKPANPSDNVATYTIKSMPKIGATMTGGN
ncbi:hypothetical protein [Marinifilum sp. D714]|uniref:hypothetical protein n=1 Tax=Marinifilum sp. D714 TaxID=2937523 RepID=UPI0027CFE0C8|nr:hypothetical protein [Marinifilum sp. D714]MDQ2179489.1 hypothetical protein [Marinifilum sp. D714]